MLHAQKGKDINIARPGCEVFLDVPEHPYQTAGGALYSMKHLRDNQIQFTGRTTADLEMNLQLMLCGNIGYINEVVYRIRQHGENASGSFKDIQELDHSYFDLINFIYGKALP